MLNSFRHYLGQDDHSGTTTPSPSPPQQQQPQQQQGEEEGQVTAGTFRSIRHRASKTLPNFNLALPSIAGIRDRTFGTRKDEEMPASASAAVDGSLRAAETGHDDDDHAVPQRRRSRSTPPAVPESLRRRAMRIKDSAILDLKSRASAIDLPRFPSFHFSLPFSESPTSAISPSSPTMPTPRFAHDTDNVSMTSLEVEALATHTKAENNRLRGLLDGLPKIGIPRFTPDVAYAGLSEATADLNIVVLGGYRGSILRSAEDGRMLWVPVKLGLGMRKVDLALPLEEDGERDASKTILPDGMLTHIGPLDISRRLLRRLRDMQERGYCTVHEFGYDWRLGGECLTTQLIAFLERLGGGGKTLVIAHSLGGLLTLSGLNRRPDLFRGVVFAGTPFHGCPNILGPFRYGDGVLLNKSVLNAQTNFSMRSSFLLLPTHKRCFVDIESGKELPIDFFDPDVWKTCGLSPMVADDMGEGDLGESSDGNAMMASGGIGGPAMGNDTTEDETTTGGGASSLSAAAGAHKAANGGRGRIKISAEQREAAAQYLTRTLAATRAFKESLRHNPDIAYPPLALLRASNTPTVRGCQVHGYAGIKEGDYSKFIFSPGDGVVTFASSDLATLVDDDDDDDDDDGPRAARWPIVKEVENDRGHIGLLGDLAGVASCIEAILKGTPSCSSTHSSRPGSLQDKVEEASSS